MMPSHSGGRPAVERTLAAFEVFQQRLLTIHAVDFAALDFTMAQAKLLYVVMAAGELHLSDIARRLGVTASTASGAVDHLVDKGFLTRTEDSTDRRQVRISVTPAGSQILERMRELSTRQLRRLLDLVDDAGLAVIERSTLLLTDAATTLAASPPADDAAPQERADS